MQDAPREPTITRDLATLADLYFTLAWNVGRRALKPRRRLTPRKGRIRRSSSVPRGGERTDVPLGR
jgi:hypothetical protein